MITLTKAPWLIRARRIVGTASCLLLFGASYQGRTHEVELEYTMETLTDRESDPDGFLLFHADVAREVAKRA